MKDVRGRSFSGGMLFLPFLLLCLVGTAQAQDVNIDGIVTGNAVPGGTVMVQADVTDGDGNPVNVSSYSWSQVGGPAANLSNTSSMTVTVGLPGLSAFKANLLEAIDSPPIDEADLPPNIEIPEGEFHAGIQSRFQVLGINHFALEHGGMVELELTVTTASGNATGHVEVIAELPWKVQAGINNVAIGHHLLLNGKDQESYDWVLFAPGGSAAVLSDATTRNPEFTPDVDGEYTLQVTDESDMSVAEFTIYAGEWRGIIEGQDENGRPEVSGSCNACHEDTVADWKETGHAEIFTDMLNTNTHWGPGCFECHSVGYNPDVDNNGLDDQSDYMDWLNSGLINAGNPDAWTMTLADYEDTAQLANIQCENCHGPQDSDAHMGQEGAPRVSLASDTCATCHGEPLRHGRFQQWQLSAHSNYELAIDEGESGSCSRCHTVNGFLAWLPALYDPEQSDIENVEVTWTAEETHPQTCVTCHDPHNIGTISGDNNNAIIRIQGDTPELIAGFTATDVGTGAICMTCHNTRRGLRNESNWAATTDRDRAPHPGAQTDVIMGQNAYLTPVGIRGAHSNRDDSGLVEDTCASCHMQATPPPADISYNQSGTNHTFYADKTICSECHEGAGDNFADIIQGPITANLSMLHSAILNGYNDLFEQVFDGGGSIAFGEDVLLTSTMDYTEIELGESRGRQALNVVLADSSETGLSSLSSITVNPPTSGPGAPQPLTDVASDELLKAGWNYFLIEADGSHGVHNPSFAGDVIDNSIAALGGEAQPCTEDANTICLKQSRFEVKIEWRNPNQGFPNFAPATVSNLRTADSGIFYFNNPENLEFLLKVVDGCSLNNNYWVFFAATTNVEFNVTVRDTLHDATKSYNNPLGQPADAVTDTMAFATCP